MDAINFIKLREEIIWSLCSCGNYTEWAQHFEKIIERLQPNSQICELIMDLSVTSQVHRDYLIDFASWLCSNSEEYRQIYEEIFKNSYETISQGDVESDHHRIYEETKFFAVLFWRDSISWNILSCITLKEYSSSCKEYFITLLLLEMSRNLGSENLCARLMDPNLQKKLDGLFPKDKIENSLYAMRIFELVNLQQLALDLQKCLNTTENDELTLGVEQMSL
ncbi:pre-mRNA-splicing factor CWC22 homolog [Belonocnema kinseyi]|uniref:pre-mRNA-splicing factor CWC22 homolog n=1 Tax=Belonocnema kinseyi TaxID=2817044 RepID=UPI00143D4483|nr:pre-mRNA-splicing factor CWC22 homolog [Belonocnema kinseyi]